MTSSLGLSQPRGGWDVLGQEGMWAPKCRPLATLVPTLSRPNPRMNPGPSTPLLRAEGVGWVKDGQNEGTWLAPGPNHPD